jgi:hypothetical protein
VDGLDDEALSREILGNELAELDVVVDQQHAFRSYSHGWRSFAPMSSDSYWYHARQPVAFGIRGS